jgi:Flp pilus assembly protein TadD
MSRARRVSGFACLLLCADGLHAVESRWIRLKSDNFELYSGGNARSARDTLKEFEQVRGFFIQASGGHSAKSTPVRLVAFGSTKEYEPYRINEFAIAYYHQTADRDYIVMSRGGADTFPIAVHEYVHLLVRHGGMHLPPWLNEGLAELYSTLRPMGDKILVGDLIAGRHQALLQEKWVPLQVILAVDQHSPYYNEKNKAGSFYNESWALTHMLYFRAEYRPKFSQLLRSISDGKDSAAALLEIYGKTPMQIEKDLQAYLRGSTFQGALVAAHLEKASGEIAEPLPEFDANLMLADLLYRPGKEAAAQAAMERLVQQEPKRPEPYRALGYLAWHQARSADAVRQFAKAYDCGDRDPKLLWDYGRLLESDRHSDSARLLAELLALEPDRVDVRLEVARLKLQAGDATGALATLAPIHSVTPADSARFFQIAVYAHLNNGDQKNAAATAKRFKEIAKTNDDRAGADLLISQTELRNTRFKPAPAESRDETPAAVPSLKRSEQVPSEPPHTNPAAYLAASGRFVQLDCHGKQARMIVETATGRQAFLIEDPGHIAITSGASGPVDMTCGPQKAPAKVEVGYVRPAADQKDVQGVVRTLAF